MTTMIVDELGRIPMSPFLTATLTRAADYATQQAHREVTLEHLLLALTEDPEATVVLKASQVDLPRLSTEVSEFIGRSDDRIDPASGQPIAVSADLRRILEAAAAAARQGRRREINGAIVLAAIVGDGKSTAANLLRLQGLTFEEAIRALQQTAATPTPPPSPQPAPAPMPRLEREPQLPPPQERTAPPVGDPNRPATTEEILASARERLHTRGHNPAPHDTSSAPPATPPSMPPLPRANYPELNPARAPAPPAGPDFDREQREPSFERGHHEPSFDREPGFGGEPSFDLDPAFKREPALDQGHPAFEREHPPSGGRPPQRAGSDDTGPSFGAERPGPPPGAPPPAPAPASFPPAPSAAHRPPPPPQSPAPQLESLPRQKAEHRPEPERRRAAPPSSGPAAGSGPFVGSWPLIEAGQLVENIPRRMRVGVPIVAEARIARADVKALVEGLAGGGAAFRHEIVVTKAMSVRLRAPDGGFSIENRSPETQWIENVLGLGADDFASWRWTVTPRSRGRRQLQLIVSARTVGADGVTAETALPDQVVDVKVAVNYAATLRRWLGWIAAAVIGGLLAKFGEVGYVVVKLLAIKHFGG